MAEITEAQKAAAFEELRRKIQCFSNEELAWDFHCNIGDETRKLFSEEAKARGVNLCLVNQKRRGGGTWEQTACKRKPCGGCSMSQARNEMTR